jgi:RHS repeat-associated protein
VRFTYQGMGRISSRTEAGTTVGFTYDTEENLVAITNEHGDVYRFELDQCGRIAVERCFDGLRRQYERDKAGRVVKVFRPANRTTKYEYDDAGRVAAVAHSSGESEAYAYRPDGELIEAKNDTATVKLERDLLGRIVREVVGDDWVASQYDAMGARVRVTSSKGLDERITRDAMGRAIGIRASVAEQDSGSPAQAWEARIVRDIMGLEVERHLPGGVQSRWERDAVGRPVKQEVWAAGTFRRAVQYTWDVNDRLKMVVDAMRGPTKYEHDALGNLAAATHADGHVDLRMPDAVGNLFRTRDRTDRKYGPAGQLLEARREDGGLTKYDYDPEGNLIRKTEHAVDTAAGQTVWRYEWNDAGMLARVIQPSGVTVTFGYDALGRRVWKNLTESSIRWTWDGNVIRHEFGGQQAVGTTTWLFEPERFAPAAKHSTSTWHSVVTDALGSASAMYSPAGEETWSGSLDAFGRLQLTSGERVDCPFRWPGQYDDADVGLHYNRFRYYSPEIGTYVSADPIGLAGGTGVYSYVPDPLTWKDPFGLSGCGPSSAAEDLPQMKGMSVAEAEQALADNGFQKVKVSNSPGKNQTWRHGDGSEVLVHPYGDETLKPWKTANNAHVHKIDPLGNKLTDRGIPSTVPNDTHIGIKNPSDLPQVRGRPHGAGTL